MGSDRERAFEQAIAVSAARAPAERARKRAKAAIVRPWKVLEVEWHEQMHHTFGAKFQSSPWGPKEKVLAKKLLKESDLALAIKLVRHFIATWDRSGSPSFGYFWKVRDTLRGQALGQVKTRRQRIDVDEYDGPRPPIDRSWGG